MLKKKLMKLWKSRTRERVRQHGKEVCHHYDIYTSMASYGQSSLNVIFLQERAVAHRYYTVVGFAFQKWKQRYQNSVRSVQQVHLAIQHNDHRLMGLIWTAWAKVAACMIV